jgi:hypothetical protein
MKNRMNIKNRKARENPTRNSVGFSIFFPMKAMKIPMHTKIITNKYLLLS